MLCILFLALNLLVYMVKSILVHLFYKNSPKFDLENLNCYSDFCCEIWLFWRCGSFTLSSGKWNRRLLKCTFLSNSLYSALRSCLPHGYTCIASPVVCLKQDTSHLSLVTKDMSVHEELLVAALNLEIIMWQISYWSQWRAFVLQLLWNYCFFSLKQRSETFRILIIDHPLIGPAHVTVMCETQATSLIIQYFREYLWYLICDILCLLCVSFKYEIVRSTYCIDYCRKKMMGCCTTHRCCSLALSTFLCTYSSFLFPAFIVFYIFMTRWFYSEVSILKVLGNWN